MTAFILKLIALLSMAIDHTGAVLFEDQSMLRVIGRIAFPIYCFMIAEGFFHTRSVPKYLARLGLFALISEIPFDLAIFGKPFYQNGCNVFFTLFLGLLAVYLFDLIIKQDNAGYIIKLLIALVPVTACCCAADSLATDYKHFGVLLIFVFYLLHDNRAGAMLLFALVTFLHYGLVGYSSYIVYNGALCRLFTIGDTTWYIADNIELFALFAIFPMSIYNGEKGPDRLKLLFYAFYPAHLLLLWLIEIL